MIAYNLDNDIYITSNQSSVQFKLSYGAVTHNLLSKLDSSVQDESRYRYNNMCTRNDGTKLRQYWIVLNFVDLSSLANQARDLKAVVRINRETRFAFLHSNTLDSKRLILYASTTFLKQHDLMA